MKNWNQIKKECPLAYNLFKITYLLYEVMDETDLRLLYFKVNCTDESILDETIIEFLGSHGIRFRRRGNISEKITRGFERLEIQLTHEKEVTDITEALILSVNYGIDFCKQLESDLEDQPITEDLKNEYCRDVVKICKSHKVKDLSYQARIEWVEKKIKKGKNQYKCSVCGRWLFKSEI